MVKRDRGMAIAAFLALVSLLLAVIFYPFREVKIEPIAIPMDAKSDLVARIYTPKQASPPYPTMILAHGVSNSKAMMAPLATEFARHGITAIAFDFRGYGESSPLPLEARNKNALADTTEEDLQAVFAFLRSHPQRFDLEKLGILGHSLGGNTALPFAHSNQQLQATIVLSTSGFATPQSPPNLLLATGIYDQINPAAYARENWQPATQEPGKTCIDNGLCGHFARKTARQLFLSSTSDHVIAPYDPQIIAQSVRWGQQALPISEKRSLGFTFPYFILAAMICYISIVFLGIQICQRYSSLTKYRTSWFLGMVMAVVAGMAWGQLMPTHLAAQILFLVFLGQLAANYSLLHFPTIWIKLRLVVWYGLFFVVFFWLATCICGISEGIQTPVKLIDMPRFFLQWLFFIPYNYSQAMQLALFPVSTLGLQLSWLWLVLVAIELWQPGWILTGMEWVAVRLVKRLRLRWQLAGVGRFSRKSLLLLGGLLVVAVAVIWWQTVSGQLAIASAQIWFVLRLGGLLILLPASAMVWVVRSRWFQGVESWLLKH
jgi:dienelactone hydrolase